MLLTPHVRTAAMENVPQGTSLGEWTSLESATVTLPTLNPTWKGLFVITAAHSGIYHARGNLALVLLTPHARTAATGECDASYSLRGVDITGFCYLESQYIESYVDMVLKARGITTDNEDGDQGDNSGSGSGSIVNFCEENCPFEGTPCEREPCTGAPNATCENRCDGECAAMYFLMGVDITEVCNHDTSYIESYVERAFCNESCPFKGTPCEREPCTGAPNATCENRCDGECAAKYFLRGVDITEVCNRDTSYIESYVETAFCKESCPFNGTPCEREPCTGAPNATCENRCDGECAAKYFLRGVDITGVCNRNTSYIESYVETAFCNESCPFNGTPCEREPCTGAPNATCQNRCDGECPTWKLLFVKRAARSGNARGNLALVLLTPREWTSLESATVTLPTLSRTWHRFFVTSAHSGTYHARGNLALVLLTPHVRTAAMENVP